MKKTLYLAALTASQALANTDRVGKEFLLLSEIGIETAANGLSQILAEKYQGDSGKISEGLQDHFLKALRKLQYSGTPLEQARWQFYDEGISGDSLNVGLEVATADSLVLGNRARLGIQPDTTYLETTRTDTVNTKTKKRVYTGELLTGARLGVSYGPVSPELGLVFGGGKVRFVVSGSPYSLPSAKDPKAVTTYTAPDPVFGTMYETTVDTARVAKNMKNLSLGVILPPYKGLEATLGLGIHWEENSVKGNAKTGKVDRNYVPLTHAEGRSGPFHSSKRSTSPTVNGGLDYKVSEHDAVGFSYQRVLGENGKNRAGLTYRRNF